jgi:hypothetical protein
MPTASLQQAIGILLLVGSALLVAKLCHDGLWRRYRVFFLYFAFRIPNSVWPLVVSTASPVYFWLWLITSPICLVFYVLVVVESYRLILEKYHGLETMGRWAMYAATGVSVFISVLALLPHITPAMPQSSRVLGYEFALERGVDFSLVVFILLMLVFLGRFPIPLSRNVIVHAAIFSLYFLSAELGVLLHVLWGMKLSAEVSLFLSGASLICVGGWLWLLNPAGETAPARLPVFGSGDEQRILLQLETVNTALLRASRKI